jgi:segregation and condensation protein B
MTLDPQHLRMAEALLFAAAEPLDIATIKARLPEDADIEAVLAALTEHYQARGVTLRALAGGFAFATAPDLAHLLEQYRETPRRLSRAATETLAIIAYHQPVTRAEIEEIRGVALGRGTLDLLLETGWARMRGRRRTPGRPITYGTTDAFLIQFGLEALSDLPGIAELKAAGLLDSRIPSESLLGPAPGESPDVEEDPLEEEITEDESASDAAADDDRAEMDAERPPAAERRSHQA